MNKKRFFLTSIFSLAALFVFLSCEMLDRKAASLTLRFPSYSTERYAFDEQVEIDYFHVILDFSSGRELGRVFDKDVNFNTKLVIPDLKPGEYSLSVKAYQKTENDDGICVGEGSENLFLKSGSNSATVRIYTTSELNIPEGTVGSKSKPVSNIAELQEAIRLSGENPQKSHAVYVYQKALQQLNAATFAKEPVQITLVNQKVSLHFVPEYAQADGTVIPSSVNFVVDENSELKLVNDLPYVDCASFGYADENLTTITSVNGNVGLYGVGVKKVQVLGGTLTMQDLSYGATVDTSATSVSYTNENVIQVDNSTHINVIGKNDALIDAKSYVYLYLHDKEALNEPEVVMDINRFLTSFAYSPVKGLFVKPAADVEGSVIVDSTFSMPEGLDYNDYVCCGLPGSATDKEYFINADGIMEECISSIEDIDGSRGGLYYVRTVNQDLNRVLNSKQISKSLVLKGKKIGLRSAGAGNANPGTLYFGKAEAQGRQNCIEVSNGASLSVKNLTLALSYTSNDGYVPSMIQVDRGASLNMDAVNVEYINSSGINTTAVCNEGSVSLNDVTFNIGEMDGNKKYIYALYAAENSSTVISGKSVFRAVKASSKADVKLGNAFELSEMCKYVLSDENDESTLLGKKIIDNAAGITGLGNKVNVYVLKEGRSDLISNSGLGLSDEGTIVSLISTYDGLLGCINSNPNGTYYLSHRFRNDEPDSYDNIVVSGNLTLVGFVVDGEKPYLDFADLNSETKPVITVKKGASLKLVNIGLINRIQHASPSGDPDPIPTSQAPLMRVEQGGVLNATGVSFTKNNNTNSTVVIDWDKYDCADHLEVYGTAVLKDCWLSNEYTSGLTFIGESNNPLISVLPEGSLEISNSVVANNSNTENYGTSQYALGGNLLYVAAGAKTVAKECLFSNLKYGMWAEPYYEGAAYTETDVGQASEFPLVLCGYNADVSIEDSTIQGGLYSDSVSEAAGGLMYKNYNGPSGKLKTPLRLKNVVFRHCGVSSGCPATAGALYVGCHQPDLNEGTPILIVDGIEFIDTPEETPCDILSYKANVSLAGEIKMQTIQLDFNGQTSPSTYFYRGGFIINKNDSYKKIQLKYDWPSNMENYPVFDDSNENFGSAYQLFMLANTDYRINESGYVVK